METNAYPNRIQTGRLSIAVIVSLLLGICFFSIYIVLEYIIGAGRDFKGLLALFSILASIAIVYLITPLLSLTAIINTFRNWRTIVSPDNNAKNEDLIRKIAYRYSIASILLIFSAVSLLPALLEISIGKGRIRNLPVWLSIWFLTIALLALAMGFVSYKLFIKASVRILTRAGAIFAIIICLDAVSTILFSTGLSWYSIQHIPYSKINKASSGHPISLKQIANFLYPKITETFIGDSNSLKQTAIIPTLDSPCPEKKNVIWCSSFQLAWNQMKDDVIGEPVQVVGAEKLAVRLNSAEQSASDLEPNSLYVAAGRVKDGIIDKIHREMAVKFPSKSVPDFSDIASYLEGILAYSYLIANVPFEHPYRQAKKGLSFTDSRGIKTNIGAFGVWGFGSQYERMREQAEILYLYDDFNEPPHNLRREEFAIDLCKHSSPYQVVAAVVEPKDSLAQTLDYIDNQITDFKKKPHHKITVMFGSGDVLMVPEMFWEIDHRFDELLGKTISNANPSMPIIGAKQSIKFKLDRCGAILESEATIKAAAIPRYFKFDRPFLVYMKKRDCERPFFVMWVDNAELLNKK